MGTGLVERHDLGVQVSLQGVSFLQDPLGLLARQAAVGPCFKPDQSAMGSVHQGKGEVKVTLTHLFGAVEPVTSGAHHCSQPCILG